MSEAQDATRHAQNYAEVRFETRSGETIMEPLKIFRGIDESYQVATPVLSGYVLVKQPDQLTRIMTTTPTMIRLIYSKIGSLQVYHGLADMTGELITLHNSEQPDQVAPIELQVIPDHDYYVMTDDGLRNRVKDPKHYQPEDPAGKSSLVSLTLSEKDKVDEMEAALTIDPEAALPELEALHRGEELPVEQNETVTEPILAPDDEEMPSGHEDRDIAEAVAAVNAVRAFDQQADQLTTPTATAPSVMGPEKTPQSLATTFEPKPVVQKRRHVRYAGEATPVTLLAQALALVSDSLVEAEDAKTTASLISSSQDLLSAMRTLTLINLE